MLAQLAHVTRGALVESTHLGSVAVLDGAGEMVASAGDPEALVYIRSSGKPFQAVPLVVSGAADAFGFTTEELALACASHDATAHHQAVAASMLRKAGLGEPDLRCGFSPPLNEEEKAKVILGMEPRSQIKCECSGEHAGMLAACHHRDWPIDTYNDLNHPLQREVLAVIAGVTGVAEDNLVIATDGCSIPTFGVPLRAVARAYAILADPYTTQWDGPTEWREALVRLREAMVAHPDMIAGEGNLDTDLMHLTGGRIVAKLGAEGLLCLAVPERRLGIAIVDADGSQRGLGPAVVAILEQLDLVDASTLGALREQHSGQVLNFAGTPVGEIQPVLTLESHAS